MHVAWPLGGRDEPPSWVLYFPSLGAVSNTKSWKWAIASYSIFNFCKKESTNSTQKVQKNACNFDN
jgi:hypothetical protein